MSAAEERDTAEVRSRVRSLAVEYDKANQPAAKQLARPSLAGICATLPGKYKRIPTYVEPFDAEMNGGLQTGRIVVFGGPPGVTKTGLALAMTYEQARRGVVVKGAVHPILVAYIAGDEPRDGCLSRLAQIEGLLRSDLDNEDRDISVPAWAQAAERIGAVDTFTIWDTREDPATVESITEYTAEQAAAINGRVVVVVDSLQVTDFAIDSTTADKSLREQMNARMKVLRALSIKHGVCFVVLSELNRSGYGQNRAADIASFKETGGIEYGVDVGVLLSRVKKEAGFVIEANIVKSRLGESDVQFRLERTARCTFRPVEMPDAEDIELARLSKVTADHDRMAEQIVQALLVAKVAPTSRPDLLALVTGANDIKSAAVTTLITNGRIAGGRGKPFHVLSGEGNAP